MTFALQQLRNKRKTTDLNENRKQKSEFRQESDELAVINNDFVSSNCVISRISGLPLECEDLIMSVVSSIHHAR